jgi:hypothetical protein
VTLKNWFQSVRHFRIGLRSQKQALLLEGPQDAFIASGTKYRAVQCCLGLALHEEIFRTRNLFSWRNLQTEPQS